MSFRKTSAVGVVLVAFVGIANAQKSPFIGKNEFPQFRQISGLSGGGYGLDADGWGSLDGATAFSTPLGIALGHDQFRIDGADTAFSLNHLPRGISNDPRGTAKAFLSYGHSFGELNFAYTYFVKSGEGDSVTNLQVSYSRGRTYDPAVSFGVQDLVGNGGSAGQGIPGDSETSRSFFGALTVPVALNGEPLFLSGGYGSRRFQKGFASASYRFWGPFRGWTEYDGFGINEGLLVGYRSRGLTEDGAKQHAFEADLLLGFIRGRYPTIGLTVGY
jgi:hypothetical protein